MQQRFAWMFSILLVLFGTYGIFFSEKISVNEGKGWDGHMYVQYTQEWPDPIVYRQLPPFYLKKTLLPAMVHYACSVQAYIQGVNVRDFPVSVILHYYDVFNFIWLCLALFLIYKNLLKLFGEEFTSQPWWIFLWVTMNVFIMKMIFYYPALLDTFSLSLAALLLYGHLTRKKYWLLIAMAAGFFTHPLLFMMGTLLMLWPEKIKYEKTLNKIYQWIILFVCFCIFSYWLYDAYTHYPDWVRPAEDRLIILSVICTLAYLSFIVYWSGLLNDGLNYLYQFRWKNLIPVVLLYSALTAIVAYTRHEVSDWDTVDFLRQTGYDSIQDPLVFIVTHVVYFGPGILIIFIISKRWKSWLKEQTGGLQLVIWIMFIFMVNNESRQLVVFWPFALLLIIAEVSRWKNSYLRYLIALVLIAWSRVWFRIPFFENDDYYNSPAQYYFMYQGPWMSVENYYWQAAVTLIMGLLLYFYKKYLDEKKSLPS